MSEDVDWLKKKIERYKNMLSIRWTEIEKLKTRSSFWHGKWAIVCHENNVLRKKINDLERRQECG